MAALAATACASRGDVLAGGELPACFRFERDDAARALGLPWGVELRADSLEGWGNLPDAHVALTRVSATETADHPLAYWMTAPGDSLQIGHPGGGVTLTLAPTGRDLAGRGSGGGDAVAPGADPPGASGAVRATRVTCGEGEG